jgi:S-adenosylmethionine-dependent methyltransferase
MGTETGGAGLRTAGPVRSGPGRSGLPRSGVVWAVLDAELDRAAAAGADGLDILDLGGGSGVSAVPLAGLGHRVTVVDASADALATLQRRAADAGVADRVTPVQGDVERMPAEVGPGAYDLVLCHGLLEVVDSPAATLGSVAGALRPGGCASVLAAGRAAAVLARALGGRLADAARIAADPAGRSGEGDGLLRRFDAAGLRALVAGAGLRVESEHGVRVVADLVPGALLDQPGAADALRELETTLAALEPFRDVAAQLHVLARR